MMLAAIAICVVIVALLWDLLLPPVREALERHRARRASVPTGDSDDVLAKWMALTGDERHLIATANMHLPGRQIDPRQVRRDLWRLAQWERGRMAAGRRSGGGVIAP
jgi:hypothetical protein